MPPKRGYGSGSSCAAPWRTRRPSSWSGEKPVSVEEYNRLKRGQAASGWEELLEEIRRVRAPLVGRPLPPPEEVIRELREERGERLTGLR